MAEEDHATHGRHRLPLVAAHEPQGLQIAVLECTQSCERLGSRSEVEVFRAEPRQGLIVETLPPGETAQLLDQLGIGAAVCGAHPHIHACGRASTWVCRQGRISVSGTNRGLILSLIRLASRSSSSSWSATSSQRPTLEHGRIDHVGR